MRMMIVTQQLFQKHNVFAAQKRQILCIIRSLLVIQVLLTVITRIESQTTTTTTAATILDVDNDCSRYPPGVTLEEFNEILSTISGQEFSSSGDGTLWNDATCFQWKNAILLEDTRFPFLVCLGNENSIENGKDRYNSIKDAFNNLNEDEYSDEKPALLTVYNRVEYTCFITTVVAKDMRKLPAEFTYSFNNFRVTPMSYYMKIVDGTLESLANDFVNSYSYIPLNTMVCPGVLEDLNDIEEINDITAENLRYILEPDATTGQPNALKDLFWAQEAAKTDQAQAWLDYANISLNPDSSQCKNMYNSLTFRFYRIGVGTGNAMTMMETRLYSSYVPSGQKYFNDCVFAILLAISLRPQFCSVQLLPPIEPKQYYYTYNTPHPWITQSITQSLDKRNYPFYQMNLDGRDEVVAVSDYGLDVNNCYFYDSEHGGIPPDGDTDMDQRKIVQFTNYKGSNGHGSPVCGAIAGNKALDGTKENEELGWGYGIAFNAKIAFYDMSDNDMSIRALLDTGSPADARIHCASWGLDGDSVSSNSYGNVAQEFDAYMASNPYFLIVTAAGNDGLNNKENTVSDPGTAKNVLTVGSSQSYDFEITSEMLGYDHVSGFSSRGPTKDGRTKPDIVAPGEYIIAATSDLGSIGQCDPQFPPSPGSSLGGLQSKEGTSYAAAIVAGSAALVRQYFKEGFYPSGERNSDHSYEPTASLMKGVIMHGAQFLEGVQNEFGVVSAVTPYDNTQNFGRISLVDSLYLNNIENGERFHMYDRLIDYNEDRHVYQIQIVNTMPCHTEDFRVTLVWTDPPAVSGCTQCLLNNLDLVVMNKGTGVSHFPNGLNKPEVQNNAERIIINARYGDIYQISVIARNLFTDTQKYSLVFSGCIDIPTNILQDPATAAEPSNYVRIIIAISASISTVGLCCCIGICFVEGIRRKLFNRSKEVSHMVVDDDFSANKGIPSGKKGIDDDYSGSFKDENRTSF